MPTPYKVHLHLVVGKKKPVGPIDALFQGASLEYRRGVAQRITGKGDKAAAVLVEPIEGAHG
jgi:hypothetical protein